MEFLDTPVDEMTVRDQLKLGAILAGISVGITVMVTVGIGVGKLTVQRLEERKNNQKEDEEK